VRSQARLKLRQFSEAESDIGFAVRQGLREGELKTILEQLGVRTEKLDSSTQEFNLSDIPSGCAGHKEQGQKNSDVTDSPSSLTDEQP
jgi:hypothetical protein